MKPDHTQDRHLTEKRVQEELQCQPSLMTRLIENSLTVATSLRENYFKNTARFITDLRRAMDKASKGERPESPLKVCSVGNVDWSQFQNEVVTFIDGGVGRVQLSSQVPILLRVGSYCVRTGKRQLAKRERFGYYPVILGDLEGGSKERKDFPDIVRITAELLGGLSALERTPALSVLMFHGPLVYLVGGYAGHTPFTEKDIDLFLHHYARDPEIARQLKEKFLNKAFVEIYPKMTENYKNWKKRRLFEPLAWIAFLYRQLIQKASERDNTPIIAGVVERGDLREFSERILLERVFQGLRKKNNLDYFNKMYGRSDLDSPKSLLDKLGYTDTLLLAMLLRPGEYSEHWSISKYDGLRKGEVSLPGESGTSAVNFEPLKPGPNGFPEVLGFYVHVSETTEPIRVEVFKELVEVFKKKELDKKKLDRDQIARDQIAEAEAEGKAVAKAARRVYLYSRLLPGYGFPVGLDIADKFAHVPNWLTNAYSKLIRHHLGVSLQRGEISDAEMRRILIQAIYMTHRDWLFRPSS